MSLLSGSHFKQDAEEAQETGIGSPHDLQLEELAQYFHLPISEAAKAIGICATVLKKICRKNNIPRWPHRKIKSIDKMISVLESSVGKNPEDDTRIKDEIKTLSQHREYVMKNPDSLVQNTKRKRESGHQGGPPNKKVRRDDQLIPSVGNSRGSPPPFRKTGRSDTAGMGIVEISGLMLPGSTDDAFSNTPQAFATHPSQLGYHFPMDHMQDWNIRLQQQQSLAALYYPWMPQHDHQMQGHDFGHNAALGAFTGNTGLPQSALPANIDPHENRFNLPHFQSPLPHGVGQTASSFQLGQPFHTMHNLNSFHPTNIPHVNLHPGTHSVIPQSSPLHTTTNSDAARSVSPAPLNNPSLQSQHLTQPINQNMVHNMAQNMTQNMTNTTMSIQLPQQATAGDASSYTGELNPGSNLHPIPSSSNSALFQHQNMPNEQSNSFIGGGSIQNLNTQAGASSLTATNNSSNPNPSNNNPNNNPNNNNNNNPNINPNNNNNNINPSNNNNNTPTNLQTLNQQQNLSNTMDSMTSLGTKIPGPSTWYQSEKHNFPGLELGSEKMGLA